MHSSKGLGNVQKQGKRMIYVHKMPYVFWYSVYNIKALKEGRSWHCITHARPNPEKVI